MNDLPIYEMYRIFNFLDLQVLMSFRLMNKKMKGFVDGYRIKDLVVIGYSSVIQNRYYTYQSTINLTLFRPASLNLLQDYLVKFSNF